MLAWLLSWFRPQPRTRAVPPPAQRATPAPGSHAPPVDARHGAPHPQPRAPLPAGDREQLRREQIRREQVRIEESESTSLHSREMEILERLSQRIASGGLELPQLASTSINAIGMCARPNVEVREIVALIEHDPALSSELLRTANSVLYAGAQETTTLDAAVVRLGMRALRSMLYAVSVRGTILRDGPLAVYAEEIWRRANSTARLARALAPSLRIERERAFLIGLLYDVGRLPLLSMLRREIKHDNEVTPALVGRVFLVHHEAAGAALAHKWNLPAEIESVAGNHHRFEANSEFGQGAALASFVHRIDAHWRIGGEEELRNLVHAPELDFLKIPAEERRTLLEIAANTCAEALHPVG